jgi:hypothetical protein
MPTAVCFCHFAQGGFFYFYTNFRTDFDSRELTRSHTPETISVFWQPLGHVIFNAFRNICFCYYKISCEIYLNVVALVRGLKMLVVILTINKESLGKKGLGFLGKKYGLDLDFLV